MAHAYPQSASSGSDEDNQYYTGQRITINADYLYDFVNAGSSSFGVFGGIFVGYHEFAGSEVTKDSGSTDKSTTFKGGIGFGFNVGLAATLNNQHKVEFGAKIPVVGPSSKQTRFSDTYEELYKYASVNVGYSFIF